MRKSNTHQYFSARQPGQILSQDSWTADRGRNKNPTPTIEQHSGKIQGEQLLKLLVNYSCIFSYWYWDRVLIQIWGALDWTAANVRSVDYSGFFNRTKSIVHDTTFVRNNDHSIRSLISIIQSLFCSHFLE